MPSINEAFGNARDMLLTAGFRPRTDVVKDGIGLKGPSIYVDGAVRGTASNVDLFIATNFDGETIPPVLVLAHGSDPEYRTWDEDHYQSIDTWIWEIIGNLTS